MSELFFNQSASKNVSYKTNHQKIISQHISNIMKVKCEISHHIELLETFPMEITRKKNTFIAPLQLETYQKRWLEFHLNAKRLLYNIQQDLNRIRRCSFTSSGVKKKSSLLLLAAKNCVLLLRAFHRHKDVSIYFDEDNQVLTSILSRTRVVLVLCEKMSQNNVSKEVRCKKAKATNPPPKTCAYFPIFSLPEGRKIQFIQDTLSHKLRKHGEKNKASSKLLCIVSPDQWDSTQNQIKHIEGNKLDREDWDLLQNKQSALAPVCSFRDSASRAVLLNKLDVIQQRLNDIQTKCKSTDNLIEEIEFNLNNKRLIDGPNHRLKKSIERANDVLQEIAKSNLNYICKEDINRDDNLNNRNGDNNKDAAIKQLSRKGKTKQLKENEPFYLTRFIRDQNEEFWKSLAVRGFVAPEWMGDEDKYREGFDTIVTNTITSTSSTSSTSSVTSTTTTTVLTIGTNSCFNSHKENRESPILEIDKNDLHLQKESLCIKNNIVGKDSSEKTIERVVSSTINTLTNTSSGISNSVTSTINSYTNSVSNGNNEISENIEEVSVGGFQEYEVDTFESVTESSN